MVKRDRVWEANRNQFEFQASLVTQMVKNPLAMLETWVRSLGWEDLLEKGPAIPSSILVWRVPMDRGAWWATSMASERVGHG